MLEILDKNRRGSVLSVQLKERGCNYCTADLHVCFGICKFRIFHHVAHLVNDILNTDSFLGQLYMIIPTIDL